MEQEQKQEVYLEVLRLIDSLVEYDVTIKSRDGKEQIEIDIVDANELRRAIKSRMIVKECTTQRRLA